MAKWIKGRDIILYTREQTGTDDFGAPVYTETAVTVVNVVVAPSSGPEIVDAMNLYGKKSVLTLCIPKGDANTWENRTVGIDGTKYRVIGAPLEYMESMVPMDWNRKVQVEHVG